MEIHAEYIRHTPGFSQIWLAGNLVQARMIIERFKPGLILLDSYLPGSKGITSLYELTQTRYSDGMVFITTANDVKAVSEAVHGGAPNYLIKPIIYEWLGQILTHHQQRRRMLASNDSASQKQMDEMFNVYVWDEPRGDLPTRIDASMLNAMPKLSAGPTVYHIAEMIAQTLIISRTTSGRYPEYCASRHLVIAEIIHDRVDRSQRIYHGG